MTPQRLQELRFLAESMPQTPYGRDINECLDVIEELKTEINHFIDHTHAMMIASNWEDFEVQRNLLGKIKLIKISVTSKANP